MGFFGSCIVELTDIFCTALLDDYVMTNTFQYIDGEKIFNANINVTGFVKINKDDGSVLLTVGGDALLSSQGGVLVEDVSNLIVTTFVCTIGSFSNTITPPAPSSTTYLIQLTSKRKTLTGGLSFRDIQISTNSTEAQSTNDENNKMSGDFIDETLLNAAGLSQFPELNIQIHERELKPIVDRIANQIIVGPQYQQDYVKDIDDKLFIQPTPTEQITTPKPIAAEIITKNHTPDVVVNQGFGYYPIDLCDFSGSYLIDPQLQESNQKNITSNGQQISHIDSAIMQDATFPSVLFPPSVFLLYSVTEVSRDQLLTFVDTPYDLDTFKIYVIDDTVSKLVMINMHLRQKGVH
ncbi:MAG: hypothetical protein EZS28_005179 [Streblomastix strix]|uniref:Uncharacterized protein n=1 Tax=Streblomastix strix TaxID=222440 RepID=A0A5J4WWA7_9EUKA|nr:MAG: hypothetical protein EZS28_005179 [Streblomastix strix]